MPPRIPVTEVSLKNCEVSEHCWYDSHDESTRARESRVPSTDRGAV